MPWCLIPLLDVKRYVVKFNGSCCSRFRYDPVQIRFAASVWQNVQEFLFRNLHYEWYKIFCILFVFLAKIQVVQICQHAIIKLMFLWILKWRSLLSCYRENRFIKILWKLHFWFTNIFILFVFVLLRLKNLPARLIHVIDSYENNKQFLYSITMFWNIDLLVSIYEEQKM